MKNFYPELGPAQTQLASILETEIFENSFQNFNALKVHLLDKNAQITLLSVKL